MHKTNSLIRGVFYGMYFKNEAAHHKFLLIFVLVCNFVTVPAVSQNQVENQVENQAQSPEDLIKETIFLDVTTSTYYELQEWLRKLNLEQTGSRRELENRLLTYYRTLFTEVPRTTLTEESEQNTIQIEKAQELAYEKIDDKDALIRLEGGIALQMRDIKGNTTHTISAETLTYNQKNEHVTAGGRVVYKMQQSGSTQEFEGEQISFNLEDYSGVFIEGMSTRQRQIEDKAISFYFKGGAIYRIKRDIVNLNEGIISSSRLRDPYYRISAGNLWILDLNEWALQNAVLYVGHIPVLYVPFFYRPGATFALHPSIGMNTVEGYYFQTTTYFLGRQPKELSRQSSLSFMQALEDDQHTYEQELRGFFLHSTREQTSQGWTEKTDSYGKLQVDYYSRLGLLTALNFTLNDLWHFDSLELLTGAGFTNYIYSLPEYSNAYTIYTHDVEENIYHTTPQNSYVLGQEIPFRFGFDLKLKYSRENLQISLNAPFYSDLLLHDQFRKRNETFAWSKLITGEGIQSDNEMSDFTNPKFFQHSSYRLRFIETTQYVDTFNFSKIDSRLNLSQGSLEEDTQSLNKMGYYYPQSFTPLDLEMKISGKLLRSTAPDTESQDTESPPDDLRPPWKDSQEEDKNAHKDSREVEKLPPPSGPIAVTKKRIYPFFEHSLSYSLSPDLSYHTQYDTEKFEDPENVDFSSLYSYLYTNGSAHISYAADLFRNSLQFDQSTRFRGRYRDHFDEKNDYNLDSLIAQDKALSYLSVVSVSELKHFFLQQRPNFSNSYTGYKIETELYRYSYNRDTEEFEPTPPEWNTDSIKSHSSEFRLKYDSLIGNQEFFTTYKMPPELQQLTGGIKLSYNSLGSSVQGKYTELEDETWEFGPLEVTTQLNFFNSSKLSQNFTLMQPEKDNSSVSTLDINIFPDYLELYDQFEWNLTEERPIRNMARAEMGWLSAGYEMRYTDDYTFSLAEGWKRTGSESFQPYQLSAKLDIPFKPEPLWKNRIELSSTLSSAVQMNMIRYTDSVFQFSWNTTLSIAEFLDMQFEVNSANNTIYRYIPAFTDEIGVSSLDLFDDLYNSVSFLDTSKRLASKFNLQNISFSLIHYMHDWQLNMEYSGRPTLTDEKYTWNSEFSIFVQWNPIPEIRKQVDYTDDDGLQM